MARGSRFTMLIIIGALLVGAPAGASTVAAQDERVLPASELEALCKQNAPNRKRRQACLDIVRTILAPDGSIVVPAVEPPSGPIEGATVGDAQATDHLVIQLAELVWDAEAGFSPDEGFRWIAGRFEVESTDPDAHLAVPNFTATDDAGFSHGFSTAVDPSLENGDLPAGQRRMGWVSFQVPEESGRIIIEYFPFVSDSQEPLRWTVENTEETTGESSA